MKKTCKRLGAVLLAAFLMLSTMVCASADDTAAAGTANAVLSKTITLNVNNISDGDLVSAYRLVSYKTDANGYDFNEGFEAYINANKTNQSLTAEKYLESLDSAGVNSLLEGYATECQKTEKADEKYQLPKAVDTKTATSNKASLTLQPGYYLLLTKTASTNNRIYTPIAAFVKVDGTDLVVYAGNSTNALTAGTDGAYTVSAKSADGPTIDKQTNATQGDGEASWKPTASAGVGELVRFYVKVNIPAYTNVKALNLTVNDTLSNLKYNKGTVKVYDAEPVLTHEGNTTTVSGTEIQGAIKSQTIGDYTVSNGNGTQKLTFDLDYEKIMGDSQQAKSVYVYYETTVQKEAVAGSEKDAHIGENIANLTYANAATPDSKYTTDNAETDVYDYYLKITKIKGETEQSLKGAKFALYLAKDSNTKMNFVKETNTDGSVYYRPAVDGDSQDSIITDIEADFQIRGLDANTYYLEETETPSGYYKPAGRFEIHLISKTENGKHTGKLDATNSSMKALETADANLLLSPNVDSNLAHEYSAGVKNSSTPNLPTTGGAGTMLLSIGGVVLMVAGAYLIFFRKKEN